MKRFLVFLPILLAVVLTSCGGAGRDALLQTVPADTEFVAVIDMKSVTSGLGSDGLRVLADSVGAISSRGATDVRWSYLLSEDSKADFSKPFVAFEYNRSNILTFFATDASKFRNGLARALGSEFEEKDGIWVCAGATVFMKADQVWFASAYPAVDVADIAVLSQLGEQESILSVKAASKALDSKFPVASFLNIEKAMQAWSLQQRLILNTLFDDASYLLSFIDFEKGKVTADFSIVNYKGKPATFSLKAGKLEASQLKSFDARGLAFAAISVSPDMARSVLRQLRNFTLLPSDLSQLLEKLDGDLVVALGAGEWDPVPPLSFILTFKNADAAEKAATLARNLTALGGGFRIFTDKKRLFIVADDPSGSSIDEFASRFDGAYMGAVLTPEFFSSWGAGAPSEKLRGLSVMFIPDGKGVRVVTEIDTDPDRNPVLTLFRLFCK